MKRLAILLIMLPLISSATVQAQSAKQSFKAGEEFYKSMNFGDAIDQ